MTSTATASPNATPVGELPSWQYRILRTIHQIGTAEGFENLSAAIEHDRNAIPPQSGEIGTDYQRWRRLADAVGIRPEWLDVVAVWVKDNRLWNNQQVITRFVDERTTLLDRHRTRRGLIDDMTLVDHEQRHRAGTREILTRRQAPLRAQFQRNLDLRAALAAVHADLIGTTAAESVSLAQELAAQAARNREVVAHMGDATLNTLWCAYASPHVQSSTGELIAMLDPSLANQEMVLPRFDHRVDVWMPA